ncbi:Uncharacterised protein [Mycobacteroides abscessus subsp. abscessus]|nr:Uncharacterised protein [Mycobacteroides abscessus subsp. abscessus]
MLLARSRTSSRTSRPATVALTPILVLMKPGHTADTPIPLGPSSIRMHSLNILTAAFDAE